MRMMRSGEAFGLVLITTLLFSSTSSAGPKEDIDRAVARGVQALKRMQGANGRWPYTAVGPTALAGLTLLECGVSDKDPAIQAALAAVRKDAVDLTHSYSLSTSILFLDRLGYESDRALIESMAVRLLAGQTSAGGWSYNCPSISNEEVKRLKRTTLTGSRKLPKFDPNGKRRTVKDLPEEIQKQITLLARFRPPPGVRPAKDDNSNTQFAVMALWAARRHGVPVSDALARVDLRFRRAQFPNGGWSYSRFYNAAGEFDVHYVGSPSGAMTCAGLIGLALQHGMRQEELGAKAPDPSNDRSLKAGLLALSTTIGRPIKFQEAVDVNPNVMTIQEGAGGAYYFLWSIERVAVALDLQTIGKKDWYTWGAQILVKNQRRDGTWAGHYSQSGADTCFSLLFLRRANLTFDLSARFKLFRDPGEVTLRTGGVGGDPLKGRDKAIKSSLDPKAKIQKGKGEDRNAKASTIPAEIQNKKIRELTESLVRASGASQDRILEQLRVNKGAENTGAIAYAIPLLEAEAQKKARKALARRLTRMTSRTLKNYLGSSDIEIRLASVNAVAMKDERELIPDLIEKLDDTTPSVVIAARFALKAMTKQDFGPEIDADVDDRLKALRAWKTWWRANGS